MSLWKTTAAATAAALLVATGVGTGVAVLAGGQPVAPDKPVPPSAKESSLPAAAKPAEPAVAGTVAGRVVRDADGKPAPGADVRLHTYNAARTRFDTRRVVSTADGSFTFPGVPPGQHYLYAFAGNTSSRTKRYGGKVVTVPAAGDPPAVELRTTPGVALRVKVLSEATAAPIAGARVRLVWTDADRDHATDANGEVELRALTAETWTIEAGAKGYAVSKRAVNLDDGRSTAVEVRLPPGAGVEGRVRDPEGRPVPGVGISAFRANNEGGQIAYTTADAEGRYRLDYLPLGSLQLNLSKQNYLSTAVPCRIEAADEKPIPLDLIVHPRPHGGSVRGTVTDSQGRPVAGAEITNEGRSSTDIRRTGTDAQGVFLLDNVYEGPTLDAGHEFVVRAKGFAPKRVAFMPGPAARPAEADVKLGPGHRISGRVIDQAGKPVGQVRVYFAGGGGWPRGVGGSGATDTDGRFRFDSLPEAAPFSFRADGYSPIENKTLPLDGDTDIVVTMTAQGVIRGRVVDAATGKPVPRFVLHGTFSPDRQPGDPQSASFGNLIDPGETFASPAGQFLVKDLAVGLAIQVSVTADGYQRQVLRRVVAAPTTTAEALEIRLTPEDPAKLLTIRGKFLDHRGDGVRGAELRLIVAGNRPTGGTASRGREDYPFNWGMIRSGQITQAADVLQFRAGTTAGDGGFEFRGVPDGAEIELAYWGKGVPQGRSDHIEKLPAAERTGIVIKVPAPARLTGIIDRTAFPEISQLQLAKGFTSFPATLSADGKSFAVEDLPAGQYEVQVYGLRKLVEGKRNAFTKPVIARKAVTLAEGKEERVAIDAADRAGSP